MIEIEIDGKKLEAESGSMIIQAADEAGIYIPRFCYHKKLSIAANCRMCLVEVEKAPKTLPACATPVAPGMKVFTQSEKTIASQKAVMEYLLINHPLDCPICDQGGECELQDLAMGFGRGISRYQQGKRSVKDKNLGPLIASEMTRCIQCTRCVRFGDEIAGERELGATGRGELMEIGTYVQHVVRSELSGNIIDLCPVGALTSKPYRFSARAWEMQQHPAIAPHDCLGSNIYIHTRTDVYSPARHVMRVVPRENELINENWLSDRDRFSYEGINSPKRLTQPFIKQNGIWTEVDWTVALQAVVSRLQTIQQTKGTHEIGAFISPSATTEDCYLLQKLLRGIGSDNIDFRIRQTDFSLDQRASLFPLFNIPLVELESLDTVFLVGSDLRREQPLANQRVLKASKKGATVLSLNPENYDSNLLGHSKIIAGGDHFILVLARILKALCIIQEDLAPCEMISSLGDIEPKQEEYQLVESLLKGKKVGILLGAYALNHPKSSVIFNLIYCISKLAKAKLAYFTEGANAVGALLAGAVPHRGPANQDLPSPGLNADEMLKQRLRAYILCGLEPELDFAKPALAYKALKEADTVVALSAFDSQALRDYADIILPIASFAETSGTYVNMEGRWQFSEAVTIPRGNAQAAWNILRVLANLFGLAGFDYSSIDQVQKELKSLVQDVNTLEDSTDSNIWMAETEELEGWPSINLEGLIPSGLKRLGQWPMYRIDSVVRHAQSLQATYGDEIAVIRINSRLADKLHLVSGALVTAIQDDSKVSLPLVIDNGLADDTVAIYSGIDATLGFGEAFGDIFLASS